LLILSRGPTSRFNPLICGLLWCDLRNLTANRVVFNQLSKYPIFVLDTAEVGRYVLSNDWR
jgi:hypothetical protein